MPNFTPLAQRVRPKNLTDIIGQHHLLGDNAPIRRIIATGHLPSLILHGEAGIGKTTLASLLADAVGRPFHLLSAVNSGVKEIRQVLETDNGIFGRPVVFVDEIHRFNKAQQDALLSVVETGQITLIGATTENPSFAINNALLSRCQVYRLYPLSGDDIKAVLKNAINKDVQLKHKLITLDDTHAICQIAQGDARKALNLLELAINASVNAGTKDDPITVDDKAVLAVAGEFNARFDKDGDNHYNLISAMIKSVRGSDADASLYWLARLLVAGEDPAFIARRLVISASEDIGLANPNALLLADTALRSVQSIGMPEARIILGQVAVYLATSPKSNTSYQAINKAIALAKTDQSPVPLHLCNGVTKLAKQEGYGADYRYPHDYPNHYCPQSYLPPKLFGTCFYEFGDNAKEQASFAFIKWLKNQTPTNQ